MYTACRAPGHRARRLLDTVYRIVLDIMYTGKFLYRFVTTIYAQFIPVQTPMLGKS